MSETAMNLFSGSHLNRLSWLRHSHAFLNAVVALPSTRWLLLKAGSPLVSVSNRPKLAYLLTSDVKPLLGPEPFFGQGKVQGTFIETTGEKHSNTDAARHLEDSARVVFLGLEETGTDDEKDALPSSDFIDAQKAVANLKGTAYFSMDVSELDLAEEKLDGLLKDTSLSKGGNELKWIEARALMSGMDSFDASVFAEARSLADWNLRHKFCAGCGSSTYSMWGGWKITCRTLLPWADNTGRKPCPSGQGLHNYTHPRTDAVVIMIAIDQTGEKILLGHNVRFPGKFYSALAGFIEPGETFEDAVAREMWEEAGVKVWDVRYHSGQPWPYPANLMVGFYARADSTKPIRVDLDNELADAQWFTRAQISEVLNHPTGATLSPRDHKKFEDNDKGKDNTDVNPEHADDPPFRVPPTSAIAGMLIRDWADRKIGFPPLEKVNL